MRTLVWLMFLAIADHAVAKPSTNLGIRAEDSSNSRQGTKGARIVRVKENSPASKAELKKGDIVIEFNGLDVDSAASLTSYIKRVKPGAPIQLTVRRKGKALSKVVRTPKVAFSTDSALMSRKIPTKSKSLGTPEAKSVDPQPTPPQTSVALSSGQTHVEEHDVKESNEVTPNQPAELSTATPSILPTSFGRNNVELTTPTTEARGSEAVISNGLFPPTMHEVTPPPRVVESCVNAAMVAAGVALVACTLDIFLVSGGAACVGLVLPTATTATINECVRGGSK